MNVLNYDKFLCLVGDASFGIYLLHPLFIMICDKLIPRSGAAFLITFVFVFASPFGTVWLLNKIFPKKVLGVTGLGMK